MSLVTFASMSTGLVGTINSAEASCPVGGGVVLPGCAASFSCKTSDGRPGHHLCPVLKDPRQCTTQCIADTSARGIVRPNYIVIDILYAPPGTTNKSVRTPNTINYQKGGERTWT